RAGMEGTAIGIYNEADLKLIEKQELKGIQFIYADVNKGEVGEAKSWNERRLRTKATTNIEQEARKRAKKKKKVKMGYKKKMKQEQESNKRQLSKKTGSRKKR